MSHQVIARKWRPQRFDSVIGQDHITGTLKYAVMNGRIAPVYLFTGIRGTGKTTLARIMVKSVNCLDLQPDGEPCNKCESCIEISEGRSPDVVEIDGASNNSVDDVRNIKENISYFPVRSKYKIYIIDEVHMLSKSAFNALLKTLEEPPSHTLFILATTDPQKIPPTVLSRCQRYDLKRLSLGDVTGQLCKILECENRTFDPEALYAIAREGEGSMRDSQTILEQLMTFSDGEINSETVSMILGCSDKKHLRGIIEAVIKKDAQNAVSLVREIYKNGKSIEKAALDTLLLLHNIVLFSELQNPDFIEAPQEEIEWIKECSKLASPPDWLRFFRFFSNEYETIKSSDFSLMLFEVTVITACGFPLMDDFRSFAQKVAQGASAVINEKHEAVNHEPVSKPVSEPTEPKPVSKPVAEPVPEPVPEPAEPEPDLKESKEDKNWKTFTEHLKDDDVFFHGALVNIPYKEDDFIISLSIDMGLEMAKKDILNRLRERFADYFKGSKELEINLEASSDPTIHGEIENDKLAAINEKKEAIKNSTAYKEAVQMGLELKKINVE